MINEMYTSGYKDVLNNAREIAEDINIDDKHLHYDNKSLLMKKK
jgi:hypothetical protein